MRTRLLIDCNYLCHRAFYTFGELQHANVHTGVVYGFLRDIIDLQDRFKPECFIFCFDSKQSHRMAICPSYKKKRKERSLADKEFRPIRDKQIKDLRRTHLPALGYKNIFCFKGYEADDIIASLVSQHKTSARHVIVSSDRDLFQLLDGDRVVQYIPTKHNIITSDSLKLQFGVGPDKWADVKAIAGCGTDEVEGIEGIGEKTAAKFMAGTLGEKSQAYFKIREGALIWNRNLPLVKLPLPGIPNLQIHSPEELKRGSWRHLVQKLGMWSIHDKEPKQQVKGFGIG